ncbi:argonaute-like protein [Pholiota conissans]|uniref:Argonaute-like protein n=1 Tax=Pholiota conissans TaxID=109636 RepID=A0A9P6CMA6_9AGAR|nr:argonaute-like protein [Pholiota conissans]
MAAQATTITSIGVRRPDFGRAGRPLQLEVNSFEVTVEDNDISHYDDLVVEPDNLSAKRKLVLFDILQTQQPNIFTPKIAYDGQAMAYATRILDLGEENARKFSVSFPRTGDGKATRPPRVYNVTVTKVATINTEVLRRFVTGQQAWDEGVSNALMAYNVAVRMKPNMNNPFRGRSFFIDQGRRQIGAGLEVWRGIFQSVRPVIDRYVLNVDLASTVMYREGPLIHLCNDFFGRLIDQPPHYLTPGNAQFPSSYELSRLKRFITHIKIVVPRTTGQNRPRAITGLSTKGANALLFKTHEGATMSVAQYFNQATGSPLKFPGAICVQIGKEAMVPLEMCIVLKGQFVSRDVAIPPAQVASVLEFATKKPRERLEAIKAGMQQLQFQTSDYISQFGMSIDLRPLKVTARVMDPPNVKYSGTGRQASVTPRNGAWNMVDKKFINSSTIKAWMVLIFQTERQFNKANAESMIKGFKAACNDVGIKIDKPDPLVKYLNGQGDIQQQLRGAGSECNRAYGILPTLLVIVLPEGAGDIYAAAGVATQCLKAMKCRNAKPQYWSNVMLKVNGKLGGINSVAESGAMLELSDPKNSTIIIGADVIHPAPGALNRPSFASVVGSVDSQAAKYVGSMRVQEGRKESILELKAMVKEILLLRQSYITEMEKKPQAAKPKRLIFYREACEELGMNPRITLIVVTKRHHNQMFPPTPGASASNENAPAGTVIDTTITHPTDFDFFLQSHAGLLGTSRCAHYSVCCTHLHGPLEFRADALQSLSYALCHCYAPATRPVSIPAPVYYADRVCARAKNHFDPNKPLDASDAGTQASGATGVDLQVYQDAFKQVHQKQRFLMYFLIWISASFVIDVFVS